MTLVNVPTPTLEDINGIGTSDGHIACCRADPKVFLCGAPYHPECDDDEEKTDCAECTEHLNRAVCKLGHQHCPMIYPYNPCPPKKEST